MQNVSTENKLKTDSKTKYKKPKKVWKSINKKRGDLN